MSVFSFIAAISTEAAHEEVFYQCDISCHCLLAFIHFMGIASYNEWCMEAAHIICHRKLQRDVVLKNNLKNLLCLQLLIHHCLKLLACTVTVIPAVSRQRQEISWSVMTIQIMSRITVSSQGKITFQHK